MHYANEVTPAQSESRCELTPDRLKGLLEQADHMLHIMPHHPNGSGVLLRITLYVITDHQTFDVTSTVARSVNCELSVDNAIILIGSDDFKVSKFIKKLSAKLFGDPNTLKYYVL